MTSISFGDYAGSIETKPDDLTTFTELWYETGETIVVQLTPENGKPFFLTTDRETILDDPENLLSLRVIDGTRHHMYFQVNPALNELPGETSKTRKEAGVKEIRGFYADLDLKAGSFTSTEQIMQYLSSLEVVPTIAVESGSGGIHAYWKVSGEANREDLRAWWTYLQSKAPEGVNIDRLIDAERVLRVPGSVRWPKDGSKHAVLGVLGGSGESVEVETFRNISRPSYEAHRAALADVQKRDRALKSDLDKGIPLPGFNNFLLKALVESKVNSLSWDEVLIPNGWEYLRTDYGGSRQWKRPGSDQKSATTDYTHVDGSISDVMSLLSSSPDSGLLDLKDAGIPLTKYRVLLRLTYQDNVENLLKDLIKEG